MSSRYILNSMSPERKMRRLPSLKPMTELYDRKEEKIFQLSTFDKLDDVAQKSKYRKVLSHGKYAVLKHDIEDIVKFIYKPIGYDKCLESTIVRNKKCSKMGYLDYDLTTLDDLYLLSCKKMPFHLGSTYHFSLQQGQFDENSVHFLGKLKGNFVGSTWNFYSTLSSNDESKADQLDATICYCADWFCCQLEARKVEVYLKNRSFKYHQLDGADGKKDLKELYEEGQNRRLKKITKYVNKQPVWVPSK